MYTRRTALPGTLVDRTHPIFKDAVAWFPMNDNAGTVRNILAPNNVYSLLNLTSSSWRGSIIGTAPRFNGSNSYVSVPEAVFNTTGSFSASAWVYAERHVGAGLQQSIFIKGSGTGYGWQLSMVNNQWLAAVVTTSGGNTQHNAYDTEVARLYRWAHLVGTYDNTAQRIRLYVDGVLKTTTTTNQTQRFSGSSSIGGFQDGGLVHPYLGGINNVRMWNRAITPEEVQLLYHYPWIGLKETDYNRVFVPPPSVPGAPEPDFIPRVIFMG